MSIGKSEIGLAIKKDAYNRLSLKVRNFLISIFNEYEDERGGWWLFLAKDVLWDHFGNGDDKENTAIVKQFYDEVRENNSFDDVTLIVITDECEDDDGDDICSDDPWGLAKKTTLVWK